MRKKIIKFLAELLNVKLETIVPPYERPIVDTPLKPIRIRSVAKFEDYVEHRDILNILSQRMVKEVIANKLYSINRLKESYRDVDKLNTYELEIHIIPPFKSINIKNKNYE